MNSFDDLETEDDWNSLGFHEEVKIVSGKHTGKRGKVHFARKEGDSHRLEILVDDKRVFVDLDQIEKLNGDKRPILAFDLKLLLTEEERPSWDARIDELRRWNEGDPDIVSF